MPRNRSEKEPRVTAKRMATPAGCDPMVLMVKADGNGRFSVWIGCGGQDFYKMEAYDEMEANQVFEWFPDDFLYAQMPGWDEGFGRWETVCNGETVSNGA